MPAWLLLRRIRFLLFAAARRRRLVCQIYRKEGDQRQIIAAVARCQRRCRRRSLLLADQEPIPRQRPRQQGAFQLLSPVTALRRLRGSQCLALHEGLGVRDGREQQQREAARPDERCEERIPPELGGEAGRSGVRSASLGHRAGHRRRGWERWAPAHLLHQHRQRHARVGRAEVRNPPLRHERLHHSAGSVLALNVIHSRKTAPAKLPRHTSRQTGNTVPPIRA